MEKQKKKKWLIICASIVGAAVILLVILMLSIGSIVKAGVSTVLPKITGTPCSMGICTFNPVMGQVTIRDFIIGNPQGYKHPNAFKMGTLVIDVGMDSLFADKIVIEKIIIDNMQVDFELKLTETNLSTIKGNVDRFSKKSEKKEDKKEGKEDKPAADKTDDTAEKEKEGKSKKLQIDLFKFVNSDVIIGTGGETVTVPLADIIIKDIGNTPEGATVAEVSEKVFYALYESILRTVKEQSTKLDSKSIKDAADKLVDGVKGWFKKDEKK